MEGCQPADLPRSSYYYARHKPDESQLKGSEDRRWPIPPLWQSQAVLTVASSAVWLLDRVFPYPSADATASAATKGKV